ncbi:MAG: Crp/Fnr family transcriptional regulator [Candidatus Thiodiazotropha sp. (ex Lucina aurantia)]|uniref:Crp/Fnr family transcriptional regulator n=1 Tax=Candidatus Thiodiazotropha taylori TaxID=2792791 RepID=A0A9E4NHS4_9GAMM|nr:Crp/Fnr family transcriptional regulator [Candidatus Thiodiazotropha sp. (ex Lucina pensylvanica)]MBT3017774.1 Crp/Fnr family transcriptional regulator [Candidatus Thiodiazotropha taylori]MBT3038896.1 Crp/Fnr family transcriptional regulator [Candidatus Thiodiazotropha sp. (ex Codakia orbicularis)]MBV2104817.1 Crp/Fnr family transcriptional regulator [Candidatus Thiodiazotropha sp. (ex Lucina aurantia)]MCG7863534.1 Crp/Fnr family transcriptional regulator [Candidatus Thiodiazotropha endoluci
MIENVSIFEGMAPSDLALIEQRMVRRTYPRNTIILSEGDNSDSLYVILSGRVKVYLNDENGKEAIINYQEAGEYFGELSLIDDYKRSASIMTMVKSTMAIMSKQAFHQVMKSNPDIAIHLLKDMVHRVRTLTNEVKSLALSDVYGRLSKTLLSMAIERDGIMVIEGHVTQQELANRIGASREMVCRIFKDLVKGGYITTGSNQFTINKQLPARY